MSEHIVKRGGRYYYRRRVPTDLVEKYGRKEHTQALGTADWREANVQARRVGVELDAIFESLRRVYTGDRPRPGAHQHMLEGEHGDPEWNAGAVDAQDERIEELKSAIRAVLDGNTASVQPLPAPVSVSVPAAPEKPVTGVSTLADAVREWSRLRSPDSSSIEKAELYVSRFHQVNGRLPLAGIKKEHGKRLVEHLVASGLGHGTISNHVGILRAVMSSAVEAELIKVSPFADLKAPPASAKAQKKSRIPFAVEDVRTILANLPANGADRWIPLIGLYSGMRIEEIGQLAPDDVREETYRDASGEARKTHVIYVTDEGEGQGIKNRKSRRRVPVHPELIRLGFLDLVKSATGGRVFSELRPDRHGRESSSFGANFGRTFLRKTCGITDPRKTFHSFRHLFKDTMREAGVHEQVSDAITGHTTGTESRNYGDDFYPLRPLVEAINLFQLHGL